MAKNNMCPNCIHYKEPKSRPSIKPGGSARQIEAYLKWKTKEEYLYQVELRRLKDKEPFDIEPLFLAWCNHYTPDVEKLKIIEKEWLKGKDEKFENFKKKGILASIDTANGKVSPIYALCQVKNPFGICPEHKKKKPI